MNVFTSTGSHLAANCLMRNYYCLLLLIPLQSEKMDNRQSESTTK